MKKLQFDNKIRHKILYFFSKKYKLNYFNSYKDFSVSIGIEKEEKNLIIYFAQNYDQNKNNIVISRSILFGKIYELNMININSYFISYLQDVQNNRVV
jgi:hypothetical protein